MMDMERAGSATALMWQRLARKADSWARFYADDDKPSTAIQWAKVADVCYYRATGEDDAIGLKDL